MRIINKLRNRLFSRYVGADEMGNNYFISKQKDSNGRYKRIIEYKYYDEPTCIQPVWHAWLHYVTDDVPSNKKEYTWQKNRNINLTGTKKSYKPFAPGIRQKATGDYQSWQI